MLALVLPDAAPGKVPEMSVQMIVQTNRVMTA